MEINAFAQALKASRISLGYKSARAYFAWMEKNSELEFNYSYYMRFENGEALPSTKVVNSIVQMLPGELGDQLILAYCQANFPNRKRLFAKTESGGAAPRVKDQFKNAQGTRIPQKILTERQVALLADSKAAYYLFLLITVSRKGIELKDLKNFFEKPELDRAIDSLSQAKLAYVEKEQLFASYSEYAFPVESSESIKRHFEKLNSYDAARNAFFKLRTAKTNQMFRRISPRYVDFILDNIDLLLKLVRMSDEADPSHNSEVLSFNIELSRGKLPG